jgi:hypothetical protein
MNARLEEKVGVLRLRNFFASRRSYYAQDDISLGDHESFDFAGVAGGFVTIYDYGA